MIILRFTPDIQDHQVPQGMRYMMIVDCQANVDVYAGGAGGNLIMSCPYQGARCVAWPDNANQVHVEFLSDIFGDAQHVSIWFSDLPLRIDFTGDMLGDTYSGLRGYQAALPYKSLDPASISGPNNTGAMAEIVGIGGMERLTTGVDSQRERIRVTAIARNAQPANNIGGVTVQPNRFAARVATSKVYTQTFIADAYNSGFLGQLYNFPVAGKYCITFLDFSGNPTDNDLCQLLGCTVHITANSAAVSCSVTLDRSEDTATLPATTTGLTARRLDGISEITTPNLASCRKVTASNEFIEVAKTVSLRRQLLDLGIMGAGSVANPLASPFIFDLAKLGHDRNESSIMPTKFYAVRESIFSVHVEVSAATTMRIHTEWIWTQNPLGGGFIWTW